MNNYKKTRFYIKWSLVFCFLLNSCAENSEKKNSISIQWKENKATGILILRNILASIPQDSIEQLLHIHLIKNNVSILGDYTINNDAVIFHPMIPFTRGLKYEVFLKNTLLSEVEIPFDDPANAPTVLSVYPTGDTLPQNLLKFYIRFSKQMQEGEALKQVLLIKNNEDTLSSVFLGLQPELWNKDRTMLTLWFDPGRIKRDLQPNKNMGPPLEQGSHYELVIQPGWQDANGAKLADVYRKRFVTGVKDTLSPNPALWDIDVPKAGSKQSLKIYLHESLDYILLKNTLRIVDNNGHVFAGMTDVNTGETILYFIPSVVWNSGTYIMEIESRLEDLAGNNLNRLFDNDLTTQSPGDQRDVFRKKFSIQ